MKVKNGLILALIIVLIAVTGTIAYMGIGQNHVLGVEHIRQGLDLAGGVSILYEADAKNPTQAEMDTAVALIRQRLDAKNYTEAEAKQEGSKRIRVEIPGVDDPNKAVEEIGQTAQLTFVDPEGNVILTGAQVKNATRQLRQSQTTGVTEAYVQLELTSDGKVAFAEATEKFLEQPIAILLDETIISAPTVQNVITDGIATITGGFDAAGAEELASLIRAGALPFNLIPLQANGVGAQLGADALETSLLAGFIGLAIVLLFMLGVYKMPGLAANLALLFYVGLLLMALSLFEVTLTLPGIAGIILSVGMAVDANIIIFSRIKEELQAGKTLRSSVDAGFQKALSAILDGNITTLLAAAILWYLGTGPIKGFAQTLAIGIVISMFTALVVTQFILKQFVKIGIKNPKLYGAK
ncbi:MAG: protein translocase subunit SecD [Epulopiscium sp.]|nr:protein translocase subunit SecD [Candidatus Epulonipiscium sp.]